MSDSTRSRTRRIGVATAGAVLAPVAVLMLSGTAQAALPVPGVPSVPGLPSAPQIPVPPTIGKGIDQTAAGVKTAVGGVKTAVGGALGSYAPTLPF